MCSAGLAFYVTLAAGSLPHALALGLSPVHATHPSFRALELLLADCEVTYARTGVCTCVLGSWGLKGRCYRKARVASEAPACEESRRQGRAAVASARRRGGCGSSSPRSSSRGRARSPTGSLPLSWHIRWCLELWGWQWHCLSRLERSSLLRQLPRRPVGSIRRLGPLAGRAHRGSDSGRHALNPFS